MAKQVNDDYPGNTPKQLTDEQLKAHAIAQHSSQSSTDTEIPTAKATYLAARNLQALNYWLASSNR